MDEKYNGWTNYQTWNVKLWLDNDEGSQEMCLEIARNSHKVKDTEPPRTYVADKLKELVESLNPLGDGASMFTDLLQNALDGVDWFEIADDFLDDVDDDEVTTCFYCGGDIDGDTDNLDDDGEVLCIECYTESNEVNES